MIQNKSTLIALVMCAALVVPALGKQPKEPKEVSVRSVAWATWEIDMTDGSSTTKQATINSHLGRGEIIGTATWDPQNITNGPTSGIGVTTAANGDTITWILGTVPGQVVVTGGTGRFEGATGTLQVDWQSEPEVEVVGTTMSMSFQYTAVGTLYY